MHRWASKSAVFGRTNTQKDVDGARKDYGKNLSCFTTFDNRTLNLIGIADNFIRRKQALLQPLEIKGVGDNDKS
jgi:hypothetical protein